MYVSTLPQQISAVVNAAVCGAAFWRGGAPERIAAAAVAANWLTTPLLEDRRWGHPQWGLLAADSAVLVVLVWFALRTDRRWVFFAAGFQLVDVVINLAMVVDHDFITYTFLTSLVICGYFVLAALAVGTWNAWRRRKLAMHQAPARWEAL